MMKSFERLAIGEQTEDLKITSKNRTYINKFLKHLDGYVSEARRLKYKHALTRFAHLVEKDFDKLTKEEVRTAGGIINKSNFRTKTKQDIISEVRTAFKFWFGENEYFPKVVVGLKPPTNKTKLVLPEEMPQEKDVYDMVKASPNSRDKFLFALIGLDGGIRPIEARRMKWKDIKKDKHGYFVIIHTAKKSGDKDTRTVRLIKSEPYFVKWTQEYPRERNDESFVFINYTNFKPMTQGTITALVKRIKKKIGWKHKLTPYTLRHQFITRASKNPNWPVPVLKKFIGHSLASNTIAEYQHFGDDDLKDAQLKVNGIIKSEESKELDRKPIRCSKCEKMNEFDSEFCSFCNFALSQRRLVEMNDLMTENNKLVYELVNRAVKEILSKQKKQE